MKFGKFDKDLKKNLSKLTEELKKESEHYIIKFKIQKIATLIEET